MSFSIFCEDTSNYYPFGKLLKFPRSIFIDKYDVLTFMLGDGVPTYYPSAGRGLA